MNPGLFRGGGCLVRSFPQDKFEGGVFPSKAGYILSLDWQFYPSPFNRVTLEPPYHPPPWVGGGVVKAGIGGSNLSLLEPRSPGGALSLPYM